MLALFAVLSLCSATAQAAYCYSHNGVEIQNSKYYDGDSLSSCHEGASTCCMPGESCGDDLLCHSSNGAVARQYCTDPTWPSDKCSALCPDYDAAGLELTKCEDDVYCCGPGNDKCCDAGEGIRIDKKGQIVAVGSSTLPVTSTTSSASSSSTTTEPTTTATTTSAGVPSGDNSRTPTIEGTPADTSDSSGSGLSAGASAGIGVGCALAVVIIGVLTWFFLRERKKRRALESGAAGPVGYNSPVNKGDGYYQPSMQETHMSSPSAQVHEAPAEPAAAELYGNETNNRN